MGFTRILVAVDGSAMADRALAVAVDMARGRHAALGVVHVVDAGRAGDAERGLLAAEILEDRRREAIAILRRAAERAAESVAAADLLHEGDPAEEILAAAKSWNADLIVVASHGRSGLARLVMGSVAERVVRDSTLPVLIVPGRALGLDVGRP